MTEAVDAIGNLSLRTSQGSTCGVTTKSMTNSGYLTLTEFEEACQIEYDRIMKSASKELNLYTPFESCCVYQPSIPPAGRSSHKFTGVLAQTHYLDEAEHTWKLYEPHTTPEPVDTTV
ncbi:Hypothetical protein MVR_LOCUS132 [uncultured virus]|nr:Hypothetical protein MVR_LOCUS132 [uncultured virus]